MVVRLEGTNVDEAKKLLKESNLPIHVEHRLDDAARRAVQEAKRFAEKNVPEGSQTKEA